VGIAEEARESGSTDIYELIMRAPIKYKAFDDYSRTIVQSPEPAFLNGDTAVSRVLDRKQELNPVRPPKGVFSEEGEEGPATPEPDLDDYEAWDPFDPSWGPDHKGFEDPVFDITEDANIGGYPPVPTKGCDFVEFERLAETWFGPAEPLCGTALRLLHNPLPADLPTCEKDVLIHAAAMYGSIDRYLRLRRPVSIKGEVECIVRGICTLTLFKRRPHVLPGIPTVANQPYTHLLRSQSSLCSLVGGPGTQSQI
jgi:hypothetical protein